MSRLRVLRWGRAEYEGSWLADLPGVEVVEQRGPDALLELADVVVVPSIQPVTAAVVPRLKRCQLVITSTSGFEHLDLEALRAAGISAARLPLARRDAVVETSIGMMLSLTRRLAAFQVAAAQGRWERANLAHYNATLLGTVGVYGVGVIGQRMCEVLTALGARVLRHDPLLPDSVPFETLLSSSDVLTLHAALTPQNRGRFDAATIARMKPGAILINTARGALVDATAALSAVQAGHLGGLGLDVFPKEPADLAPFAHPAVIVTPHAAGWHPGLGDAVREGVHAALQALMAGRPIPYAV